MGMRLERVLLLSNTNLRGAAVLRRHFDYPGQNLGRNSVPLLRTEPPPPPGYQMMPY